MANILKKFKNNFEDITEYYNYLVAKTKNHEQVDITNEWLIDNYYLLAEHKNNIYSQKGSLKKNLKTLEENYYFLKAIANKKNYDINFKYLTDELKNYKKDNHYKSNWIKSNIKNYCNIKSDTENYVLALK